MAATRVKSSQIGDEEVKRADLNVTTSGSAVIAKAIAGSLIGLSSTGPDAGTGDVTVAVDINGATNTTTVDPYADYFPLYDASAGANRKATLHSIGAAIVLPVTIRNCSNTPTETAVVEATVPANCWRDGHYLELRYEGEWRNLDGGTPTLTIRADIGGTSYTLNSAGIGGSGYTHIPYRILFLRRGTSVWIAGWDYAYGMAAEWHPAALNEVIGADEYDSGKKGGEVASLTFTSDLTVKITAQWSAASTNRYYNALTAEVILR